MAVCWPRRLSKRSRNLSWFHTTLALFFNFNPVVWRGVSDICRISSSRQLNTTVHPVNEISSTSANSGLDSK